MPTIIRGLTIALILATVPRLVTAGGPVQSLPKDGCWVKFFLEIELSGPDGVNGEHTGSWTISSVGTQTVNGEKCRWIEIEEHIDQADDGKPFTGWFKYLVREKDLKPGRDPLKDLIEYWHKDYVSNQDRDEKLQPPANDADVLPRHAKDGNSRRETQTRVMAAGRIQSQTGRRADPDDPLAGMRPDNPRRRLEKSRHSLRHCRRKLERTPRTRHVPVVHLRPPAVAE